LPQSTAGGNLELLGMVTHEQHCWVWSWSFRERC
jgi:hypothetical protein